MAKRKPKTAVVVEAEPVVETFKPSSTIGEAVIESLEDITLEAHLGSVGFSAPVGEEDLRALYAQIHAMPWSQKPYVDIYCVDGKTVKLTVDVGGARFRRVYVAA